MEQQLILFNDDPIEQLKFEQDNLKKKVENIQRGLFARHTELAKKYVEAIYRIEMLEAILSQKTGTKYCIESNNNQTSSSIETRRVSSEKVVEFNFA